MVRRLSVVLVTVMVMVGLGMPGYADSEKDKLIRSSWVPNVGFLTDDEQPLGDLWTFECPWGGMVSARVDTKDDRDTAQSNVDPILEVLDGEGGLLAFAGDNVECTYPPVCGFACPRVTEVPCGKDNPHSLLVRDFGAAFFTEEACATGGGYELTVTVFDPEGNRVAASKVQLGGGATRQVPDWAVEEGKAPVGPALDDENVPLRSPVKK
jgi:hypothetical protein